jgi:hypothetical protein
MAVQDFSVLHCVHTDIGIHPVSYVMGSGALSPGVKRQGSEADSSSPSSAEIKKGRDIPPLPNTSSWHIA